MTNSMRNKWVAMIFTWVLMILAGSGLAMAADHRLPGEGQTLTFAYSNWSGDWLPIHVNKVLIEKHLGYEVEIADLAVPAIWAMIAAGHVDAFPDAWFPNQDHLLEEYGDQLEIISWHYDDAIQGWGVPTWFAEAHGIETIQDLNDPEIAALLDRTGDGKGDLFGCELGWVCNEHNDLKLAAYGLDGLYQQVEASETLINYSIQAAMENNDPVLFYRWTPDWIFAVFPIPDEVVILRDAEGTWNPDLADPGEFGWGDGSAGTLVHKDFKNDHPEAYALMSQVSTSLQDVNVSVHLQIVEGETSDADLERHAREWIEENRDTVDTWLEAAGLK